MGEATAARGFTVARQARAALLRHFSVRTHIVSLILVIVAPLLAFSAFLVLHSAASEQEIMAGNVRARTREAVAAIDHELGALRSRLFILAGSRHLQAGDFVGFAHAIEALKAEGLGIVLSDSDGRELVNTSDPPGELLGMAADLASIRRVVATLQPDVADFARDTVTGAPVVAINVPVPGNGRPTYVLSFNIAPLLPRILAELNLPPAWIVTIGDRYRHDHRA